MCVMQKPTFALIPRVTPQDFLVRRRAALARLISPKTNISKPKRPNCNTRDELGKSHTCNKEEKYTKRKYISLEDWQYILQELFNIIRLLVVTSINVKDVQHYIGEDVVVKIGWDYSQGLLWVELSYLHTLVEGWSRSPNELKIGQNQSTWQDYSIG